MTTLHQLSTSTKRKNSKRRPKAVLLEKNPQRTAFCTRILTISPKKPNSANRRIAKVQLIPPHLQHRQVIAHIPGIGHNLQKHGKVLLRGCRVRDLPGVRYRPIRGKFDLSGLIHRVQSRSKYGTKKT